MRSYGHYCAVAKALDVIGDRWTLLVIRELFLQGGCRHADLMAGLPGIATNLLGDRLRKLEANGLVRREAAAPPVAATLYHLTDAGRDLQPVLRALGHFGARYMPSPTGDEEFRSHWVAFPVSELLDDADPGGPQVVFEIRTGDRPTFVELADGEMRTTFTAPRSPDLVLDGPAPLVLGVLTGQLTVTNARRMGLRTEGSTAPLRRLRYLVPAGPEAQA
ncbi:winged helix-turn-helix transcriptional regulator [Amycolatopsis suaedae]|uniref:Transcriptional regulator n=1 Tax=Amycolatopsis suaedae TaxID=2510978 RepID=A0A4Q7J610_9PSEU|nr:helix-turn-helix domain-containing protein [Amycolatopsis suaedae]RZQ61434.1 transcriptional regulator [Amycolatopsis suaedae]